MATINQFSASLVGSDVTAGDLLAIYDVSTSKTKKILFEDIIEAVAALWGPTTVGGAVTASDTFFVRRGGNAWTMHPSALAAVVFDAGASADMTASNVNAAADDMVISDGGGASGGVVKRISVANLLASNPQGTWASPSGSFSRATFTAFAHATHSATYNSGLVNAVSEHVTLLSERLHALIDDLKALGSLG